MRKPILKTMAIAIVFLTVMAATVPAQVMRYVREINPEAKSPFTSWDTAATNILDAVSAANTSNAGDTVLISNGVYHLTSQVSIQNTVVRGASSNRAAVVVNGQGNVRCFYLEHSGAMLANVTVTNGNASSGGGGGVSVTSGTISNCVITKCQTSSSGGGIRLISGLVTDCLITSNTSDYHGGGVYLTGDGSLLCNSVIAGNTAYYGGGGVRVVNNNSSITNCTITGNCATHESSTWGGGGIHVYSQSDVHISDCTISNNITATVGGGVHKAGGSGDLTMTGCSIVSNTARTYGGGVYLGGDGALCLADCLIANNSSAERGGGLALLGPVQMDACYVSSNFAEEYGGGLTFLGGAGAKVVNRCTFNDNSTGSGIGGGMSVNALASDVFISNCVICANSSPYVGGPAGSGVVFYGEGSIYGCLIVSNKAPNTYGAGLVLGMKFVRCENLTIAHNDSKSGAGDFYAHANALAIEVFNSIIYDNSVSGDNQGNIGLGLGSAVTFNNVCTTPLSQLSTSEGTNNFDADPLFIGWNGEAYDYRLQRHSPCINAGMNLPGMLNAVDLDGNPRIDRFSGQVDIGCYEDVPKGTLYYIR